MTSNLPVQIPPRTLESIRAYVEHGIRPGDFLRNVMCNDLEMSLACADDANAAVLRDIVRYVINNTPPECHGSDGAYRSWLRKKGS